MKLKINYKIITAFIVLSACFIPSTHAQFWKKLKKKAQEKISKTEDKLLNKIDEKTDKVIDSSLEGRNKNSKKSSKVKEDSTKDYGDFSISHTTKYGNVTVDKLGRTKIIKQGNELELSGSWWSHSADIHDGYVLVLKNGISIDEINTKGKFFIPSEATLKLSYDPSLPNKVKSTDGFARAVTKDYQTYSLTKGEVTIYIQKDKKVEFSFSGEAEITTSVTENENEDYIKTKATSMVLGTFNTIEPEFLITKVKKIKKKRINDTSISESDKKALLEKLSPTVNIPSSFSFNKKIEVEITNNRGEKYPMEFLLGSYPDIYGISVASKEMQGQGEVIMVMTPKSSTAFMNVAGMKMKKSTSLEQMGNQYNMTDKMPKGSDFEYQKTGKTKTILGFACHEYKVDYNYTNSKGSASFWVSKDFPIQNVEMPMLGMKLNNTYLQGFVLELNSFHQRENWTIKVIQVSDKNVSINTSQYKNMGF
jgi:hypothetical protein